MPIVTEPKSKPGAENRWIVLFATQRFPFGEGYRPPLVEGGRLFRTAAGTMNCPAETGALQVK
jgi:hypothetical protein